MPHPKRPKLLPFITVFAVTYCVAAWFTDNYVAAPIKIAQCSITPPRPGDVLVRCWNNVQTFYYSGAIYLNVDRELVNGLKSADVVVIGNSRTVRTFRAPSIDAYFRTKGLRYFLLATEGSGFRFAQKMLEATEATPKILLVNNESFYIDTLEDTYREVILEPDRFEQPFKAFYFAKRLQAWICASQLETLKNFYCHGSIPGSWRSSIDGTLATAFPDPPGHIPVVVPVETRLGYKSKFLVNAHAFLNSPSTKSGCLIDYVIPSNNSSIDLARSMAADLGAPFIYPEVSDLVSFDGSHLIEESSERWARAFVSLLDPAIDSCLRKPQSPKSPR